MFKKVFIGVIMMFVLTTGIVLGYSWYNATVSSDAESTLYTLIKREHERVCSNTLSKDMRLVWVARYKAQDMAYRNYFGHTDPAGRKSYTYLRNSGISYSSWSEILAYNSYSVDISARAAYSQFMNSSPHRQSIQSCTYTRFGVGAFRDGSRKYYAVEFIKP